LLSACFSTDYIEGGIDSSPTPDNIELVSATPAIQAADYLYKITWSDENEVGYAVSILYSPEDDVSNAKAIVKDIPGEEPENVYYWNTTGVQEGIYYIFVLQVTNNQTSLLKRIGPVRIRHNLSCIRVSDRENLLSNSSFERGTEILSIYDQISGWSFNRAGRDAEFDWVDDPSQAHSGRRAIRIGKVFNGVNSSSAWLDRITVKSRKIDLPTPGGKYLFTAWVKVKDIEAGHVLFQFEYFDQNDQQLKLKGHDDDIFYAWVSGTTDWTQVVYLLNIPHWDSPPYSEIARAEKVKVGFSLDRSPGTLWVDDVSLVDIGEEEYESFFPGNRFPAPEIVQSDMPVTLPNKQGWATSIQQDPDTGIWWIVSPEQKAYWGLGVQVGSNEKIESVTDLSFEEYRNQAQYQAHTEFNFNVGWRGLVGSNTYTTRQNFIYWMNFSSAPDIDDDPENWVLKDRKGNLIGDFGHHFPDVFSPIWQKHALREAQTLTKEGGWLLTSERVLGYWTDNEFSYGDLFDFIWGDTAKLAFVDWIQGKNDLPSVDEVYRIEGLSIDLNIPEGFEFRTPYESIDQLNESWSSNFHRYRYSSFDEIYRTDKPYIRSHDDPVKEDLYAFERVIYKIYVDTIVDNIRRVETEFMESNGSGYHRPIFSNRFHLKSPAAMQSLERNMDIFRRYDVIAVNLYPTYNQTGTYLPYELMKIIKTTFHDSTGLPLYVAEFGVASEDADNYDTEPYLTLERWRKKSVQFEYQRGWAYRNLISSWANLPWVIGANWFSWFNEYGNPPGSDVRNSGLVDDYNNYYPQLANEIRSVNDRVNNVYRSPDFTLENIQWDNTDVGICQ